MPRPHATAVTATIALLGLLAATSAPTLLQDPLPPHLLGRSIDQIVDRFGLPDSCSASASSIVFGYVGADGRQGLFVFCDDVAVLVPPAGFAPRAITRPPTDKAWSGQRLAQAALLLGNPREWSESTTTTMFEYADGTTMRAYHGRAIVQPPR